MPPQMPQSNIELHCHSSCSDGRLTPEDLVALAAGDGVRFLALTDHDTMDGVAAARAAGAAQGVVVVAGMEISTRWNKSVLHLLAWFPLGREPEQAADFQAWLAGLAERRRDRNRRLAANLRAHGIPLDETVDGPRPWGRPHFARWLVSRGFALTVEEAFARYIASTAPTYVPLVGVSAAAAITVVKSAGARTSLAHPGRLKTPLLPLLKALVDAGLDALEIYYPTHTLDQMAHYVALAREHHLQASGGSDFHGAAGDCLGGVVMPEEVAQYWRGELGKAALARG